MSTNNLWHYTATGTPEKISKNNALVIDTERSSKCRRLNSESVPVISGTIANMSNTNQRILERTTTQITTTTDRIIENSSSVVSFDTRPNV
jgi:hypothetical protein